MSLSSVKKFVSRIVLLLVAPVMLATSINAIPVQAASGWKTEKQCRTEAAKSADDSYYVNCVNNQSLEAMVYRAYRVVLGRQPDRKGYNYWVSKAYANRSNNPTAVVVRGLMNGSEYRNHVMTENTQLFVQETYKRAFNKAGDANGVNYWTKRINSMGKDHVSQEQFLAYFTQVSRTKRVWSLEAPCFVSNYNAKYCAD